MDKEGFKRRLLASEQARPQEDRDGLSGYERMVHFIQTGIDIDENGPNGLRTWLGGWRAEAFDIHAAKSEFGR